MSRDRDKEKDFFSGLLDGMRGLEPERPRQDVKALPLQAPSEAWPHSEPEEPPERIYRAFKAQDEKPARLHIRTASQGSFYPSYHYLADFRFDHDFATILTLIYTFMAVEFTGDLLAPLAHALEHEVCAAIYEYHPKLYDPPPPGSTIIRAVKITTPERR